MGIPGPGQPLESSHSTFSDDLLSIEICGPDKQNLSIIDIPGIFRTPTEGVTTEDDMALVRRIMYRHIRDERTIILAVIPSNTDIATQEILTIAKEVDPKGLRTLGVLTKPDLVDNGGEENIINLVEGKRNPLRLGYHIVRNRGQSELLSDSAARNRKEKDFFNIELWSKLDRDRVGTPALQKRLQDLLVDITRREFPKVQAQIVRQLSSCRQRLQFLGQDRQSTDQQRRYLLDLSKNFQEVTNFALDAYYSRNGAFSSIPELRLATLTVDRMDEFSQEVEKVGHTISFEKISSEETAPDSKQETSEIPNQEPVVSISDSFSSKDFPAGSGTVVNLPPDIGETNDCLYPELLELTPTNRNVPKPRSHGIMEWIGNEYNRARGFDLASIGPSILPTIWQEQSKNWEVLTMAYISDIVFFVHDFIYKTLTHICTDERVRSSLWMVLQEQLLERYQRAVNHVRFIIQVERFGTPLTTNHYFNENLQNCKTSRLEKLLKKHASVNYNYQGFSQPEAVVRLDQIQQSINMNNTEHTVQDIHDILESYYKVAKKRFVDTVCMQGSDYHLLTGPDSPLRVFGTAFVSELSATQLDMIAGEDASTKHIRKTLTNEIMALEKGRKLLRI